MAAVAEREFQITRCVTCNQPLPTLVVGGTEPTREWECRGCGATYLASLAPTSPCQLRDTVKLSHYFPRQREAASTLPAREFREELRRHPRRPLMMGIPAMQLDYELFPVGEEFTILSRNLSASGIAFLHTKPLLGKLAVLIEMPETGYVQLLLQVVRTKQVGDLFEMGGEFFDRR